MPLIAACIGIEPIFISVGLAAGTPTLPGIVVMAGVATVGFVAYFAALEIAPVVVMPPLQLTPLLVVVFSVCFLPRRLERATWRVGAAALVVVIGATVVSLSG